MEIFKYSSKTDKCLVYFGILCSILNGILSPMFAIVMGEVFGMFDPNLDEEARTAAMNNFIKLTGILVLCMWTFGYLSFSILQAQAEKVSFTLRAKYLDSLMK